MKTPRQPPAVPVPDALLLDPALSESAKLLWILLQQDPPHAQVYLTSHTIRRGLAQLRATGWLSRAAAPGNPHALVPDDLLLETQLGIQPKLLYGTLQLTPGFTYPRGQFRYTDLAHIGRNTAKRAIRALREHGWIETAQTNQLHPIHFALLNPVEARRQLEVDLAEQRLNAAAFLGEALMREYLSLLIDSDQYEENAAPGFLVNPFTGERLQYDRYYPPSVAFEFNGPQHYRPTDRYPEYLRQQGRDYIKQGISATRGITLITLQPQDLTLSHLQSRLQGLLPLRKLDQHAPLIAYLESVSRRYRRKVPRH